MRRTLKDKPHIMLIFFLALPLFVATCSLGGLWSLEPGISNPMDLAAAESPEQPRSGGFTMESFLMESWQGILDSEGIRVVGYLPTYRLDQFSHDNLEHLTDLIVFSLGPNADGTLAFTRAWHENQAVLQEIQDRHDLRMHLGVADLGGVYQRHRPMAALSARPETRQAFARNLADTLLQWGWQGADLDWEYPSTAQERTNYGLLLQEVRRVFDLEGLTLTVAVSRSKPLDRLSYESAHYIHLMAYDEPGRHSTTAQAANAVNVLLAQEGVEAFKLLMGLPFYGRGTGQVLPWRRAITYRSLVETYDLGPGTDEIAGYYFNGPETIAEKVTHALDLGLGGVMIWEIGQDSHGEQALSRAITRAIIAQREERYAQDERPLARMLVRSRLAFLSDN